MATNNRLLNAMPDAGKDRTSERRHCAKETQRTSCLSRIECDRCKMTTLDPRYVLRSLRGPEVADIRLSTCISAAKISSLSRSS